MSVTENVIPEMDKALRPASHFFARLAKATRPLAFLVVAGASTAATAADTPELEPSKSSVELLVGLDRAVQESEKFRVGISGDAENFGIFFAINWDDPSAWKNLYNRLFEPRGSKIFEKNEREMIEGGATYGQISLSRANEAARGGKYAEASKLYDDIPSVSTLATIARQGSAAMYGAAADQALAVLKDPIGLFIPGHRQLLPAKFVRMADAVEKNMINRTEEVSKGNQQGYAALTVAQEASSLHSQLTAEAVQLYQAALASPPPILSSQDEKEGYAEIRQSIFVGQASLAENLQEVALSNGLALNLLDFHEEPKSETRSARLKEISEARLANLKEMRRRVEASMLNALVQADSLLVLLLNDPESNSVNLISARQTLVERLLGRRVEIIARLLEGSKNDKNNWESSAALAKIAGIAVESFYANKIPQAMPELYRVMLAAYRDQTLAQLEKLCRAESDGNGNSINANSLQEGWGSLIMLAQARLDEESSLASLSDQKRQSLQSLVAEGMEKLQSLSGARLAQAENGDVD